MAVLSVLAVAFGLTGCGDDSNSDDNKKCDPALKPATAISCDCVDNSWQFCVYPQGDKCASSNCGPGTTCDSATGDCIPNSSSCTCDDGTACPGGNKANCSGAQTCTCDDGTACPGGNKANCSGTQTCTCNDGSECPWGDASLCSPCNKADKPKGANSCECNANTHQWECKFDCDITQKPGDQKCTCEESTGQWKDCKTECLCDDGRECPEGDQNKCCLCSDGTECPYGNLSLCKGCDDNDKPANAKSCECIDNSWSCTFNCNDGDKPTNAISCECNEYAGQWNSCTLNCDDNDKPSNATCTCDENIGLWNDDCSYTCDDSMKPANASCSCNNSNGNWENCVYSCNPSEKPSGADTCDCDSTTGHYKIETCTYQCLNPLPERATHCDCDTSNGTHKNCTFTCPVDASGNPLYPDNIITGSCTCDSSTGDYNCTYKSCNEADKPTNHVVAGSCVCNDENKWECQYEPCKASDKPAHGYDCACVQGEWIADTCTYNYCDDKTWFSYQKCNPATGVITIDQEPSLFITGGGDISENGGRVTFTVKLSHMPGADVPLEMKMDATQSGRVTVTEPTGKKIAKADWSKGVTYTVTGVDNTAVDGDLEITFTITAKTTEVGYSGKKDTVKMTVKDDDSPSILVRCERSAVEPHWTGNRGGVTNTTGLNISCGSDHWDNHIYDDNDCYVKLGQKPSSNVTIRVTGSQGSNYTLPELSYNGGSNIKGFVSKDITFTPSNYNTEQKFSLYFYNNKSSFSSISSSAPVDYKFSVSSLTSSYAAPAASTSFKVYPLPKFIIFDYKAAAQKVTLPPGKYRLHAWGASGGELNAKYMKLTSTGQGFACTNHGGAGAYLHADLTLTSAETIYVYTGQAGKANVPGTEYAAYNGGGKGRGESSDGSKGGCGGGGATDFCIGSNCATYDSHWPYRILVAAGGGGCSRPTECRTENTNGTGGNAKYNGVGGNGAREGKTSSNQGYYYAPGGFVTPSGSDEVALSNSLFGKGMNSCAQSRKSGDQGECLRDGGGGAGWYGGYFQGQWKDVGGAAGSSYVFTGSNQGNHGKQAAKYALTNKGGHDGGAVNFPYLLWHGNEPAGYCHEIYKPASNGKIGNIGNGYAVIEVLD